MFKQFLPAIDSALREYSQFDSGCPPILREAIQYSLLAPGKRLRPTLVLLSTQACGSNWQQAMPAACAVEMVHAYSLIHDDLPAMDDDDLRRGQPSCHVRFGQANAILAGDALLTRAFGVLSQLRPPETAVACVAELAHAAGASGMVGGQADDLGSHQHPLTSDQLQGVHARKTGALLRVCVRMGALVAGAAVDDIRRLTDYGDKLGIAFQIVDDLLDATGEVSEVGKRTMKDDTRGKTTFPSLLGLEPSRARSRQLIDEACEAIFPLGAKAEPLAELARFVLSRRT